MESKEKKDTISACLVVYNEESVIKRCLESIKDIADEIIVVHDGDCSDKTLDIAKRYTNKIFIREHIGEAEEHRVFAMEQASGEWILQIDADEYLDVEDHGKIRKLIDAKQKKGYVFDWELWDGNRVVSFGGLQKLCLFQKKAFHYCGVPHESGYVDGGAQRINIILHHRPLYDNTSWKTAKKKRNKWVPVHATYFFPEQKQCRCFGKDSQEWNSYAYYVRTHILRYITWEPFKMLLGQLKNGLWKHRIGVRIALQQYLYYLSLYLYVWKLKKKYASRSSEETV